MGGGGERGGDGSDEGPRINQLLEPRRAVRSTLYEEQLEFVYPGKDAVPLFVFGRDTSCWWSEGYQLLVERGKA